MPLTAWVSSQEAMSSCRHRLLHVIEHGIALTHDTADMYVGRRLRRRLSTAADGQKRRPIYTYVCIDCRVYIKFPRWRDEIFMHTPDVLPLCDLGIGVFSSIIFGNRNHAAAGRRRTDAQTLRLINRPADRTTNWQTDRTQTHTHTHTRRRTRTGELDSFLIRQKEHAKRCSAMPRLKKSLKMRIRDALTSKRCCSSLRAPGRRHHFHLLRRSARVHLCPTVSTRASFPRPPAARACKALRADGAQHSGRRRTALPSPAASRRRRHRPPVRGGGGDGGGGRRGQTDEWELPVELLKTTGRAPRKELPWERLQPTERALKPAGERRPGERLETHRA